MPKYKVWTEYATMNRWERVIEASSPEEARELFDAWREEEDPGFDTMEYINNSDDDGIEEVE